MNRRFEQTIVVPLSGAGEVEILRLDPCWGKQQGRNERIPAAPNLVTTVGMNYLANYVSSFAIGTNSQMAYMAIGTSTTVASINQTVLPGEVKRKVFSAMSLSTNSWMCVTTFGGGADSIANVTIAECGVFNAAGSGAGVMWNRIIVSSQFTLANSDIATLRIYSSIGSR